MTHQPYEQNISCPVHQQGLAAAVGLHFAGDEVHDLSQRRVGVLNGYGTAEGIPDENAPEDTTAPAPADTIPGHPEPTPKYYELSIQDSAGTPGLLHEGACELRLDPEIPGHVMLAITGVGIGLDECQDTTSVNVKLGVPSRWRLSWKSAKDKCVVEGTDGDEHLGEGPVLGGRWVCLRGARTDTQDRTDQHHRESLHARQ